MKKSRTNLMFIFSIVSTLICIGAFLFFFRLVEKKNEYASNALSALQAKMVEKDNAELHNKKLAQVEGVQKDIKGHFVDIDTINKFVDYLESIGDQTKTEVTVKDVRITEVPNTIALSISIRGSFSDVIRTIALLENDIYQIHIASSYVNKDIPAGAPDAAPKGPSVWQADISFIALSS